MKIIDLFIKIENGDIPKKILYDDKVWEYCAGDYYSGEHSLLMDCLELTDLNNEVEIIEDNKKIEKFEIYDNSIDWCCNKKAITDTEKEIMDKINEIIDKLNEMGDK